jgi:hypothetical protein
MTKIDGAHKLTNPEIRWQSSTQCLVIEWTLRSESRRRCVISGWAAGVSLEFSLGSGAKSAEGKQLDDWIYHADIKPVASWKATIPNAIWAVVDVIPNSKIEIISFASSEPAFADLLLSSPHLAWLSYDRFRDELWSVDTYMALIAKKQHIILRELGFSDTKSVSKILRNLSFCSLTPEQIESIIELLGKEASRKFFAHHSNLYFDQVVFLLRFPQLLSAPLGHYITTLKKAEQVQALLELYTMDLFSAFASDFDQCGKVQSLQTLCERIESGVNDALVDEKGEPLPLPLPPLPEWKLVKALRIQGELIDHGRIGNLCLSSYCQAAVKGLIAFYVVPATPTPITFSVQRLDGGGLMLSEVKAYSNRQPSGSQIRYVKDWFASAGQLHGLVSDHSQSSNLVSALVSGIVPSSIG